MEKTHNLYCKKSKSGLLAQPRENTSHMLRSIKACRVASSGACARYHPISSCLSRSRPRAYSSPVLSTRPSRKPGKWRMTRAKGTAGNRLSTLGEHRRKRSKHTEQTGADGNDIQFSHLSSDRETHCTYVGMPEYVDRHVLNV